MDTARFHDGPPAPSHLVVVTDAERFEVVDVVVERVSVFVVDLEPGLAVAQSTADTPEPVAPLRCGSGSLPLGRPSRSTARPAVPFTRTQWTAWAGWRFPEAMPRTPSGRHG
jgi:hypothetical protein